MMKKGLTIFILMMLAGTSVCAQEKVARTAAEEKTPAELREEAARLRKKVEDGNTAYSESRFQDAFRLYGDAARMDSTSFIADYNRSAALYKLQKYQEAEQVLDSLSGCSEIEGMKADYFYNLGSCALARQNYAKAVENFKKSLLENPSDNDAKENFAYAKAKLKDQQNQNQNQDNKDNKDNQDNKDQNQDQNKDQKDKQDQNKDKQDQNKDQNQNQQNQNKPDADKGRQQGQQPQISKQAAQQMLQAIQAQEKKTQEKVKKEKAAAVAKKKQNTKNW